MTHPLESQWSFYGFTADEGKEENYVDQIKLLSRFQTIEDFWRVYSHIVRPSALPLSSQLHLFRGTSRAFREDPDHINGGSFSIRVAKGLGPYYWEQLILAMIGERFPKDVVGVVIKTRPKFIIICLWHQTASDIDLRIKICKDLCDFLHLQHGIRIDYTTHNSLNQSQPDNAKQTIHYTLKEDGKIETFEIQPHQQQHQQQPNEAAPKEESSTLPPAPKEEEAPKDQ